MLNPTTYTGLIISNVGYTGPQFMQMASGIARGVTTFLTASPTNIITSIDTGTPGAGAGVGVVLPATCTPATLQGILAGSMAGAGVAGPMISQLILGLSTATCAFLLQAQSITTHGGVGIGTGVGAFVGLSPANLNALILSNTGFSGPLWANITTAFSTALCIFLMTNVKLQISISGPSASGAATGVGSGRLL